MMIDLSIILIFLSILTWIVRRSLSAYYGIKYRKMPDIARERRRESQFLVIVATLFLFAGALLGLIVLFQD